MRHKIVVPVVLLLLVFSVVLVTFLVIAKSNSFERFIFSRIDSGLTRDQLAERDIVSYSARGYLFKGMRMSETVFSGRERDHLHDVRNVFIFLQFIAVGAALFSLILMWRLGAHGVSIGHLFQDSSRIGLAVTVIGGILIYFFFDQTFEFMHRLFFRNDLWQLDPLYAALVRTYTGDFFQSFGVFFTIIVCILFSTVYILSLFINKHHHGSFSKKM